MGSEIKTRKLPTGYFLMINYESVFKPQADELIGTYYEITDCPSWFYYIYDAVYNINITGEFFCPCLLRTKLVYQVKSNKFNTPEENIDVRISEFKEYQTKGYYVQYKTHTDVLARIVQQRYVKGLKSNSFYSKLDLKRLSNKIKESN